MSVYMHDLQRTYVYVPMHIRFPAKLPGKIGVRVIIKY